MANKEKEGRKEGKRKRAKTQINAAAWGEKREKRRRERKDGEWTREE